MTFRVKICGITNVEDAVWAVDAGAGFIGFIFVQSSPRLVSPETAAAIAARLQGSGCRLVGVFQNAANSYVEAIRNAVPLDYVQLHGQEPPAQCAQLQPAIKAVTSVEAAIAFREHADMILVDRQKSSSDQHFIADIATHASLPAIPPFLLAGGLNPENIGDAIEMFKHCPALLGFDVASGVEKAPGQKDIDKVREFCKIAHAGGKHAHRR